MLSPSDNSHPEIPATAAETSGRFNRLTLVVLAAALLIVADWLQALSDAGSSGMSRKSECRTAVVAREMTESGDFLIPRLNGKPRLKKPPLYYWSILPFAFFTDGVSEAAARYPSILSAIVLVAVSAAFSWLRFPVLFGENRNSEFGRIRLATAFMTALLLAGMHGFWLRSGKSDAESMLALSCLLINASLYLNLRNPDKKWLLSAYVFSGISFLIKGPVFLLFTWPAYLWIGRSQFKHQTATQILGLTVMTLIALPWYALVLADLPQGLAEFSGEVGSRFDTSAKHPQPLYFYFKEIIVASLPFSVWLPCAGYLAFKKTGSSGERFLLLSLLSAMAFLTVLQTKQSHYLLPLYPLLALLIGDLVGGSLLDDNDLKGISRCLAAVNTTAMIVAPAIAAGSGYLIAEYGFVLEGMLLAAWAAVFLFLSTRIDRLLKTATAVIGISGLVLGGYWAYFEIHVPIKNLAFNQQGYFQALKALDSRDRLATDTSDACFFYHFGKKIEHINAEKIAASDSPPTYYLSNAAALPGFELVSGQTVSGALNLWKRGSARPEPPVDLTVFENAYGNWTLNDDFSVTGNAAYPVCGRYQVYSRKNVSVLKLDIGVNCEAKDLIKLLTLANQSFGGQLTRWKMLWLSSETVRRTVGKPGDLFSERLIAKFAKAQSVQLVLDSAGFSERAGMLDKTYWLNPKRAHDDDPVQKVWVGGDRLEIGGLSHTLNQTYVLIPNSKPNAN
ncbi:MAG: ArnT family glycosyltransferase [Gammaproteobacteria bacterium]